MLLALPEAGLSKVSHLRLMGDFNRPKNPVHN